MENLLNWVKGIMGCLLVMSLILQCVPGKIYRPYLRLFVGIILILTVLAPLSEMAGLSDQWDTFLDKLAYEEAIPGWNDRENEEGWREKLLRGEEWTRDQIKDKAKEMENAVIQGAEEEQETESYDGVEDIQIARVEIDSISSVRISGGE